MLENNFGLSGQVITHDEFLCLSKACREEKKKKRALRNDKRELKNEERRAEIEQMRTETDLMKKVGSAPRTLPPSIQQQVDSNTYSDSLDEGETGEEDEGSNNTWLYVGIGLGVLLLAGAAFFIIRKRRKAAAESHSPLSQTQ